jgi:hypothetical protein
VVGKLLEVYFFSCTSALHGSCQQHMLLHGVLLLLVHQDPLPQYLQQLALLVLGYGTCHLWMSGTATAADSAASAATTSSSIAAVWVDAAGVNSSSSGLLRLGTVRWIGSSSSLLAVTTSGEFFVNAFMLLLLLHHAYHACVGPRDKQTSSSSSSSQSSRPRSGRASRRANAGGSAGVTNSTVRGTSVASTTATAREQPHSSSITTDPAMSAEIAAGAAAAGAASAEPEVDAAAAAATTDDQQQQFHRCTWRVEEAPPLLNAAFVSKLAVVKLSNAAFVALYSLQCLQHAQSAVAVRLAGFLFNPCHIGLVSWLVVQLPCKCFFVFGWVVNYKWYLLVSACTIPYREKCVLLAVASGK